MSARGYTRAGIAYRECRDCGGAGEQVLVHWSRDPQRAETLSCCSCGGRGYVRETSFDVLETLQSERRSALRMRRRPADSLDGFLSPTAERAYRDALALAMRPSPLPSDIAPRSALERVA